MNEQLFSSYAESNSLYGAVCRPLSADYAGAYEEFSLNHMEVEEEGTEIYEAVLKGKLRLYAVEKSTEIRDRSDFFESLENAFRPIKRICDKPKTHLKAINEVRPVETVKRIGHESIPYLASHSEDWLARTASGLKPARLFSRVEEDDYEIYENRVVRTLIDLIILFLRKTAKELTDQCSQLSAIMDSSVQTDSFGFDVIFQKAVSDMLSNTDEAGEVARARALKSAEDQPKKATVLLKQYRSLRSSRLYRYLRRAKPATNPLNETNILLMDKDYHVVFFLWKKLHKELALKREVVENPISISDTAEDYLRFCKALCEYTAHWLEFERTGSDTYIRRADSLELTVGQEGGTIRLTIRDCEMRSMEVDSRFIPIVAGEEAERFSYDGSTLFWANDITTAEIETFCSRLKNRGNNSNGKNDSYRKLKQKIDERQRSYSEPQKHTAVFVPLAVELENDPGHSFRKLAAEQIRSMSTDADLTAVALPLCNENEQKAVSYGQIPEENIAILPLTMYDINSFRRVQNIMLRLISFFGCYESGSCPCCGEKMRKYDDQWICDNCSNLTLTRTQCPNRECQKSYDYLSYSRVRIETIKKMKAVSKDNFFRIDSLFQYKNIVRMRIDDEKVRSVCPWCGQ